MSDITIYQRPGELLQQLIRFDTTNPPGNEAACMTYIGELLAASGIPFRLFERTPGRPNLVARLNGRAATAPLLLQGHVDVVTTAGQLWQQPPFVGVLEEGYIWGRGALDMKSGVAMQVAALLRCVAEGVVPPGEVILALLCDEEAGGDDGARFLVEQHAGLFKGVRYALGEFGGFTQLIGAQRFYPIMVAEKQLCTLRVLLRGPGGHGSSPLRGGAMARLGHLLTTLDRQRLPVHITPVARRFLESIAASQPLPFRLLIAGLLNPRTTDRTLDIAGALGRPIDPMLHNTVTATIVRGGEKDNVIPAEVELILDGRLLPGFTPDDMLSELDPLIGDAPELAVIHHDPGPPEPDMGLFGMLAGVLRERDPQGIPVPLLLTGVTDARHFARLGIQTYGFLPMILPPELNFTTLIHAADERIPAEALPFGTDALFRALQRF